jgi:hypothetical protein
MGNLFDNNDKKKLVIQTIDGSELLKVDATIKEDHSLSSKVTQNNIENGSDISDHAIVDPRGFIMTGIVSDTPITLEQSIIGGAASTLGSVVDSPLSGLATGIAAKFGSSLLDDDSKPSKTAKEILENILIDKIPVSIITGIDTYTDMIMNKLNIIRTRTNSGGLEFTASFKKVNIIFSDVIEVPLDQVDPDVGTLAEKNKNLGKQSANEVNEQINNKASSVLFKLLGN